MMVRAAPKVVAGVALTLAAVTLVSACAGQEIRGHPRPSVDASPGDVAGLPVTEGPSGLRPGVRDARLGVRGYSGTEVDRLAVDAIADIDAYWSKTLPADFGRRFRPARQLVSFDSATGAVEICGHNSTGLADTVYCPATDSVAWDRGVLLPSLDQMFGPMSVVTALAHEMGHAVQHRLGGTANTPVIVREQQADCYAGAVIRWVADGHAKHFRLSTGDGLNEVMATLMFIRDDMSPGPDDPDETRGSSFDRITAFQFGFTQGPVRCSKIDKTEVAQRVTELGFTRAAEARGNEPVDDATLALLGQSLNAAFRQVTQAPTIVSNTGSCADGTGTGPASYCPQDNTIAVDEAALNKLAALPPNDTPGPVDAEPTSIAGTGPTGPGLGDFAAFAEVASRYALAVQRALGIPLDDKNAGLRTACLTGSWAGVIRHHTSTGPTEQLLLAPGDLDEAVAELLSPTSEIAADIHGDRVPSGFARVSSFQDGFLQGSTVCTSQFS
ncbi:MAG TPA: neutral zinc metallopeptidase [Pseudonocardiaceae bacterium]|nr:neutral zinc metallopeptidase [Pseudonocardiaceae bacterium]